MTTINQYLKEAFAGESQAYQKYSAFAEQAEKDGFPNIAKLFRTTAEAEKLHAAGHLRALDGINATLANLQVAIEGETYEYAEMYPPMLAAATNEGHKAKNMFGFAVKAEAVHAELYKLAREAVARGDDLNEAQIYLCPVCGHIELGRPPEKCPICSVPATRYVQVD